MTTKMNLLRSEAVKRTQDQFQTLLDTLERLRRERYPQLDAALVRELLQLHADAATADAELARGVEQAIARSLKEI
jgi:hypothetical protein